MRRSHRPASGDKVRRQSIRHLRFSDVEQSPNDSQKFQHLVKLQICFEVSLVYLTIFSRLHQQLRSVTAPLNRFYVLWRHRNHRHINMSICSGLACLVIHLCIGRTDCMTTNRPLHLSKCQQGLSYFCADSCGSLAES